MLHDPDDPLGPAAPPPPPVACRKCSGQCPCVIWEEYPHSYFRTGFDGRQVFECPVHGWFELIEGHQVFDAPDTWVEGPNGEKLFTS